MQRWIKIAVAEAKKSDFKIKVGAVIFNKNQFISSGHNDAFRSVKSHLPQFRKTNESIHAEVAAILNARKDLTGVSILVIRINSKGEFRIAKPCKWCKKYIEYVGIKKVFYSINHYPYFERMKL